MQSSYTFFRVFVVNICYKYRVELQAPHLKGPHFSKDSNSQRTPPACKSCLQVAPKRHFSLQPYHIASWMLKQNYQLYGHRRNGLRLNWNASKGLSIVTSFYMFVQEQKTFLTTPIYNLTSGITIENAESYRILNFRHKNPLLFV